MNVDRIVSMVVRQIMRRFINIGISTGINAMSKQRKNTNSHTDIAHSDQKGTMSDSQKQAAKRARKLARMSRRF